MARSKKSKAKENAVVKPEDCESLKKSRLVFVSDEEVEAMQDVSEQKKNTKKKTQSSTDEETDDALTMFGKYRTNVEKIRGDLKGSQVFGFKTPSRSTASTAPISTLAASCSKAGVALGRRRKPGITVNEKENADAYFDAHGDGGEIHTSDRTLGQLKNPRLSQETLEKLLAKEPLRYENEIQLLLRDYRAKFDKWLLLLQEDFNIVTFGLGSKKGLLQDFHTQMLKDQDSLVINGFFPSLTIKHILNAITEDLLEHEGSFGSASDQVDFICGALERDLFLILHNIDGPILRNDKTQTLLAQLAANPKIHFVCSIDHINAPLIWDQHKLSRFNFVWFDMTTFLPYTEETRNENSFMVKQSGALALNSLNHVFASLTPNAKGVYLIIVRYQMSCIEEEGPQGYNGIASQDLYQRCREAFLVNSDLTLRAQLTEFRDHKLIQMKKGQDGLDYYTIPLQNVTLEEFLENHKE